ncbi:MAG: metal-dependent hydrolase [Betaproteobacteria bacterium]|nr:metal-dependent hydrolase [Betaproteobacteria bacterium]
MSQLVVRKLLIDLSTPFEARWCGGDAFRSAFFNALSMSFPVGEQFFIDSVRAGLKSLPDAQRERLTPEVQGFIGQEATHRRLHGLFNDRLSSQGLTNEIAKRSSVRLEKNAHLDVRMHVGVTAATEHFTAIFAQWMLQHPEVLKGSQARLQTMWLWHCAEESEHRSTAFDIYKALGGNDAWRIRLFHYVTLHFLYDLFRQTVRNLWHDGSLFKLGTWRSGYQLLLSKDGMLTSNFGHWKRYKSADFHPNEQDASLSEQWLEKNTEHFALVGQ